MIDKTLKRPILRYHGGKWILAPWIISHFPKHRIYVEPFGGGGSVLLRKQRCYSEVYNDVWDTVINVFKVMRDPVTAAALKQALELTPYARTEFMESGEEHLKTITCPVEKARLTILRSFAGFGSAATNAKYATGFRANANMSGTTPAHDWVNYPKNIELFIDRLKGVVIENKNYQEIILQHDSPETLVYLDPPYVHKTRSMKRSNAAYEYEFSDADHAEMCRFVLGLKSMVVISGYPNDIYGVHLNGWEKSERAAFADGANKRTEVLWLSPSVSKALFDQMIS